MLKSKVSASAAGRAQQEPRGTCPAPDVPRASPPHERLHAPPPRAQPPRPTQPQPASAAVLPPSPPPLVTLVVPKASSGPAPRAASGPRPSTAGPAGVGQDQTPAWAGAAYRAAGSSSTTRAAAGRAGSRRRRRRRRSGLTAPLPTSPGPSPGPQYPAGS